MWDMTVLRIRALALFFPWSHLSRPSSPSLSPFLQVPVARMTSSQREVENWGWRVQIHPYLCTVHKEAYRPHFCDVQQNFWTLPADDLVGERKHCSPIMFDVSRLLPGSGRRTSQPKLGAGRVVIDAEKEKVITTRAAWSDSAKVQGSRWTSWIETRGYITCQSHDCRCFHPEAQPQGKRMSRYVPSVCCTSI